MTTSEFVHIGLSGCELELIADNIIRKKSPSVEYNNRLKTQLNKQLLFHSTKQAIRVPKIISNGYIKNLFYFDMEYIDGNLFTKEFINLSKQSIDVYINNIIFYINETKKSSTDVYTENELRQVLVNKLRSLQHRSVYTELISHTINFLYSTEISPIQKGSCHGDLTLSNILFSNGNIYLLDFLDSYVESYVIDVVKLKQDLYYHWNINIIGIDSSLECRIKQVFKYMWNEIEKSYAQIIHTDLFNLLDLINLLRIEPYVKTEAQKTFLHTLIKQTKLYEKFNNPNDGKIN